MAKTQIPGIDNTETEVLSVSAQYLEQKDDLCYI